MANLKLPSERNTFVNGMNSLMSDRSLPIHTHSLIQNMMPGITGVPRFGNNEVMVSDSPLGYGTKESYFIPNGCYYSAESKEFILVWHKNATTLGEFALEAWNITDLTRTVIFSANFGQADVYCQMVPLYNSIYVCMDYEATASHENSYRTRNKIFKYTGGAWITVENGFDVAPQVASVSIADSAASVIAGRRYHAAVSYLNKVWIIGGEEQAGKVMSIRSSSNGEAFTAESVTALGVVVDGSFNIIYDEGGAIVYTNETGNFTPRTGHVVVEHNSALWCLGGEDATSKLTQVWRSENGTTWVRWTDAPGWAARSFHTALSYDGKLWVMGGIGGSGALNDVWYTTDGFTWTQCAATAPFTARGKHTSVVYSGKMWVLLGDVTSVYSSTDGATWTAVAADAGIGDLQYHASVVFDSKMWIIAGDNDGVKQDNVYSSTDGITWASVSASPDFADVCGHAVVSFNGAMWLYFGDDGTADFSGEIWSSTAGTTWTSSAGGITADKYVNYAWTFVRRTDAASILSDYAAYDYEGWETFEGQQIVGVDEKLLTGTVSLTAGALTGVGTDFTVLTAGSDYIRIDGTYKAYKLTTVTDGTNAVVENTDGDSYSGKKFALLPRIGESISVDTWHEGDIEGIEDSTLRITALVNSTTDYGRVFVRSPIVTDAKAQGATHIRIYRTLIDDTQAAAEALTHRFLKDWAIGNQTYQAGTYFRDDTTDVTLQGETNYLLATGYNVMPQGRFFGFDTRAWLGGDPANPGFWFYSATPSNVQFPQKYASWFASSQQWVSCDPADGQKDTGTEVLAGTRYFFKEKKIFALPESDPSNTVRRIADGVGCAFPNSIVRLWIPESGGDCIGFLSERGPAILTQGGQIRFLDEFGIKELWRRRSSILLKSDGNETSWYTRNRVSSAFYDNCWYVMLGDSRDASNELSTNRVFGFMLSQENRTMGPVEDTFGQYLSANIFQPQMLVVANNTRAFCLSHALNSSAAVKYRLVRFGDPTKYQDTYLTEGAIAYSMVAETGYFEVSTFDPNIFGNMQYVVFKIKYTDTDGLTLTVTSDDGRLVAARTYSQTRQSGMAVNSSVRDRINLFLREGMHGTRFKFKVSKVVPSTGAIELFGMEGFGDMWEREPEFSDSFDAASGDTTYIIRAGASPEVNAYS
jgi:hypothetical protein